MAVGFRRPAKTMLQGVLRMPRPSSSKPFVLLGGALVACVLISTVIVTQMQRRSLIDVYLNATANRAVAMDELTSEMLGVVDRALTILAGGGTSDPASAEAQSLGDRLTRLQESLPAAEALFVLDADGAILEASRAANDGRPIAAAHNRLAGFTIDDDAVWVSAPLKSPFTGKWIAYLTRRMTDRPGAAGKFVVASISLEYIGQAYRLATRDHRSVALFRRDGVLLARYPPQDEGIGHKLPADASWYDAVAQGGGTFLDRDMSGGRIIASVRLVSGLPLVVRTAVREADALTIWDWQQQWIVLGAILAILVVVVLIRSLYGHIRSVAESGASLAARNRELETARQQFDAVLSNISQGVCFFSGDGKLIVSNRRYAEVYNVPVGAIRPGMDLSEIVDHRAAAGSFPDSTREAYLASRCAVARTGLPAQTVIEMKNGRTISIRHQPMPDGGWVATHEDITEQREAEARIAHMARHDALTGLANRSLFMEHIDRAFDAAACGTGFAVLFLDLDRFKSVNDTLGHRAGDDLLCAVAQRLKACVREKDVVARFGGDEFVILQVGAHLPEDAVHLADRVLGKFNEPYLIGQQELMIQTSIGVAVAPGDGAAAETLLKNADTALYIAKAEGRGTFRFFEPEMDARAQRRHNMEQGLRRALDRGELELHYQPIVDPQSGRLCAFEALIRWNDPVHGLTGPADFIPIAEDTGLIGAIGKWVLLQACRAAAAWPPEIHVAVNLSPVQFRLGDLDRAVTDALEATAVHPSRLELEITESVLLQQSDATLKTLHGLRALGVCIVMDDFGVGYSSLSYLRSFPFDKVKIDHFFTRDITRQSDARSILCAVIGLCRDLGIRTTVEGVETMGQLAILRAEGCAEVQGFLFSRPLPADQVTALIARGALCPESLRDDEAAGALAL
jgi:diguanylate cyclase (GGDEF)-like protein